MVQNGAIENMKRDFDQMMTIPGAATGTAAL
jgi:hypothetical protein